MQPSSNTEHDSPQSRHQRRGRLPWWAYVVLILPAFIPLFCACILPHLAGNRATGFIQSDMAYYMANARDVLNHPLHLRYSNPYAPYGAPAIYSQPQTLLLALLLYLGLSPGWAFNLFGFAAVCFTVSIAVAFYREVVGLDTPAKTIGLVCFIWGGGVVTLAVLAFSVLTHTPASANFFHFDLYYGLWLLNFGRNLIYPTEAYYHGLVLLSFLFLLRRKPLASLIVAGLLSWSHPFTGLSLASILVIYALLELVLKSGVSSPGLLVGALAIAGAHVSYYIFFLNRFAEHRMLQNQWSLNWLYRPHTFIPVLFLVACFAAARGVMHRRGRPPFSPQTRLFLVWFGVIFALSQHDLFIRARQPVHFAHGYDWMALFFLGAPALIALLDRCFRLRARILRVVAIGLVLLVYLLDNVAWLGSFAVSKSLQNMALTLTQDEGAVLDWLHKSASPPQIVVADDWRINYLSSTYSTVRSWYGHGYNTPLGEQRQREVLAAFERHQFVSEWKSKPVLYIVHRDRHWLPPEGTVPLFHNDTFVIWGPPTVPAP